MIRMILRQIWNERRANALVFLELLVVSVCLFYTADYLYIKYKEYKRPLGFDIGHVYNVELGVVPEGSPDFDTTAVHTSGAVADFLTIIERLSTDPRVESVCYTHNHFHYRYWNQFASFHGIDMQRVGFVRFVDPNYFRVFKVRSFNSQSSESLERAIRENQIVVTGTVAEAYEEELAQRKKSKQDFTPKEVAQLCSQIAGTPRGIIHEPTAGNGSMIIADWWVRCRKGFPWEFFPSENMVDCWELSDRSVPILLLNLSIRGIMGYVHHGDVLEKTEKARYVLLNRRDDAFAFSEVIRDENMRMRIIKDMSL